jgi:histidinol-phosphate aminotransferase
MKIDVEDLSRNEFQYDHPVLKAGIEKILNPKIVSSYNFRDRLLEEIAESHSVKKEHTFLFYGAEQALKTIFSQLAHRGRSLALPSLGWEYYSVLSNKVSLPTRPYEYCFLQDRFLIDIESLNGALGAGATDILLGSPLNPLGSTVPHDQQKRIQNTLPDGGTLIVDETYEEYSNIRLSLAEKVIDLPRAIFIRSFSKFYGLAGLRVGYAICGEEAASILETSRDYLGFNAISDEIARMCLARRSAFEALAATTKEERDNLIAFFNSLGKCNAFQSEGNFVLLQLKSLKNAQSYATFMLEHGFKIRSFAPGSRLQDCVRITIGTPAQMHTFRDASSLFFSSLQDFRNSPEELMSCL